MDLDQVRAEIDRVDRQIIELLAERAELVSMVAGIKGRADRVRDPEREAQVVARARNLAIQHGLDGDFVARLFRYLIDYFSEQQLRHLEGRRGHGG